MTDSFSALLAAGLDDDAELFFLRMASAMRGLPGGAPALRCLLDALTARPPAHAALWREFYRELSAVVAVSREELPELEAFLSENADLAGSIAVENLERTLRYRAIGA